MERRDLPGNDASWYQALLGEQSSPEPAVEAAPATELPVEIDPVELPDSDSEPGLAVSDVAEEDEPVHFPEEDHPELSKEADTNLPAAEQLAHESSEEDRDDTAPLMASVPALEPDESPVETTSEMVGQMWTSQNSAGPLDDWEPDAMDRTISSSRPFRWTSVLAGAAVVALIVTGLVLLPSIAQSRADSHRDMLTAALSDLRAELPDTQGSLKVATEPDADTSSLSDLSTQLTVLTAKASAVDVASQADLPATPPFTSSAPIDELEPIRQRIQPLGTTAQTIQRRIANLVEYRTLMSRFLVLPDLPSTADSPTQTELRVILASAQADSASILAELPSDVSLDPHQDLARSINERFATWQVDYLEALRTGDAPAAATLVAELNDDLAALAAELTTPLAQIRRQTDIDLIDLASAIDLVTDLSNGIVAPGL